MGGEQNAALMISLRRLRPIILLLAVLAVAGYCASKWRNDAPSRKWQPEKTAASTADPSHPAMSQKAESAPSAVSAATQSLLQLHAAFRESQRCMEERLIIRGNESYKMDATQPPHIPGCDDMKGALRKVYETTTAAAQAGDVDAQLCYLMQAGGDRESGFQLSKAEIAEYKSLGPHYVNAAFERGDWRVVDLLAFHVVDSPGLFVWLDPWKDPAREYKAHQLLLLGAGDVDSQDPDDWLAALRMPKSKDDWRLSTQEIRDSDAWGQATYDKYFSSQPKLFKEPSVCTAEDQF